MSRNPRVTGAELVSALSRAGFSIARFRGNDRTRSLSKMMRDCKLSGDEMLKLI